MNSNSNFFIYIWAGVKFRRQLEIKFTRRRQTQRNGPFNRKATTRTACRARIIDMMEMNSIPQCCELICIKIKPVYGIQETRYFLLLSIMNI